MKTAQGKDLIFISRIRFDGLGIQVYEDQECPQHLDNERFDLQRLSITMGTYIASAFNSYVVKIKS